MAEIILSRRVLSWLALATAALYGVVWYFWDYRYLINNEPLVFATTAAAINLVASLATRRQSAIIPLILLGSAIFYGLILLAILRQLIAV